MIIFSYTSFGTPDTRVKFIKNKKEIYEFIFHSSKLNDDKNNTISFKLKLSLHPKDEITKLIIVRTGKSCLTTFMYKTSGNDRVS